MKNMAKFTIKRSDVAKMVGECGLIEVFDEAARRQGVEDGVLVYPEGWKKEDTLRVMRRSPRALWLMARAGLIPVSEKDALRFITESGMTFDRVIPRSATVRSVPAGSRSAMMLQATGFVGRGARPRPARGRPLPDRIDRRPV
jgi:hypothetical protein